MPCSSVDVVGPPTQRTYETKVRRSRQLAHKGRTQPHPCTEIDAHGVRDLLIGFGHR